MRFGQREVDIGMQFNAIQQGADRKDIVAGLVFSIVANYLNRVVGNRAVGEHIVLQGGVAKNPAVPLAFAQMTGKTITVPPDPELMGCFGVARLALQKRAEGFLDDGEFALDALIEKALATVDYEERDKIMQQVWKTAWDDAALNINVAGNTEPRVATHWNCF